MIRKTAARAHETQRNKHFSYPNPTNPTPRWYTFFIMAMFLSLDRKKRSILHRLCTSSTLRPSSRAACVVRSNKKQKTKQRWSDGNGRH